MHKWFVRTGCMLVAYSLLVFLSDFLPVDLWFAISNIFSSEKSDTYYKVVATESWETYEYPVLLIGVTLIAFGKIYVHRKNT